MAEYSRVEGHSNLIRDEENTAIVNTDINAYYMAKRRKEVFRAQINEINTLKSEVQEIKLLLRTMVDKLHG
jgi:hypothetical protein